MGSGVSRVIVGSVNGTGSAINVDTIGFTPSYVRLLNVTGNCQGEWHEDMADAEMQKVVDSGSGTTDISLVTSGGVTPRDTGFQIGTDTDVNVADEIIRYIAME